MLERLATTDGGCILGRAVPRATLPPAQDGPAARPGPSPALRPLVLQGEHADGYVAIVRSLVGAAHLSSVFPDPRRIDEHLALLGPEGSRGAHRDLNVDARSGLPTVRQLLAVRAERDLAVDGKLPRGAYATALAGAKLLEPASLEVRLRRAGPDGVEVEVLHDRIDAASGCLVRITAHLTDCGGRHLELRHPQVIPRTSFLRQVERHAGGDAELALILLSSLPGIEVEDVQRGQVGPLHFRGVEDLPDVVEELVGVVPSAFVLHLSLERSGRGVAQDRCRDPWGRLYRETLGEAARASVEERRKELGYASFRERRLVTTPRAAPELKAALARRGLALVVRCP